MSISDIAGAGLGILVVVGGPLSGAWAFRRVQRPGTSERVFNWFVGTAVVCTVLVMGFLAIVPLIT